MPAFLPGTEWQARAFRDAAAATQEDYRDNYGSNGARRSSYCAGVRDAFRYLLGDLQPEDLPAEFQRIRNTYLSNI